MKRKSFGVAKWSTPGERDERRVGQRVDERVGGTGEVAVAEHDQHRTGRPSPAVRRRAAGAATACSATSASGSLPGCRASPAKYCATGLSSAA